MFAREFREGLLLLRLGGGHEPNEFDESGDDSQNESREIKPRSVQPVVESGADKPAYDGSGREYEGQLAVIGELNDQAFLRLGWWRIFGHRIPDPRNLA